MSAHAGDERLGPYRLREQLGEGGMGVVYLASDAGERLVAIKVLRQGVAADQTARKRLAHEVATMRRVSSPNVAEVIDADVSGNPPYIVTRYVPGKTLEDVVAAGGPLTGAALARLAKGLAAALAAVHEAGVVHRDLKPGNVMLLDGEPVVIDFGIAQAADSTRLTMTGMFMGTPGYLAPEVIEGRPSGPAADIHSWGATMAYAATGQPPFGTGTFEAIFYRIVHGQPDLTAMPTPLVPLVLSALARDPARRPAAAELAESVAELDPAALVPGPADVCPLPSAAMQPLSSTAADRAMPPAAVLSPASAATVTAQAAAAAAPAAPAAAALAAWPGTRPMPVRGTEDFADLLPPVRYGAPAILTPAAPVPNGTRPDRPGSGAGPDQQPAGAPPAAMNGRVPADRAGLAAASPAVGQSPARWLLVLATLIALVAMSVVLPVAGTAIALLLLIGLRAADVTATWMGRRRDRQGPRGSDQAAAVAFYPWAICRSLLRFVLLAPLALLCAAGAATVAVLAAGPGQLARAGGWAAGALVACYCLGPGSAGCRRPISRLYGRATRTSFGAVTGLISVAALAAVAVSAAMSLLPGYWPATHLGQQLQHASVHPALLNHFPGNLTYVGRQFAKWFGRQFH